MGGIDTWLEFELVENVLPQLQIAVHGKPPLANEICNLPQISGANLDPNQRD